MKDVLNISKSLIADLKVCKSEITKNFISEELDKNIDQLQHVFSSMLEKISKLEDELKKSNKFEYKCVNAIGISQIELNDYKDINGVDRKDFYDCAKVNGHDCVEYEKGYSRNLEDTDFIVVPVLNDLTTDTKLIDENEAKSKSKSNKIKRTRKAKNNKILKETKDENSSSKE